MLRRLTRLGLALACALLLAGLGRTLLGGPGAPGASSAADSAADSTGGSGMGVEPAVVGAAARTVAGAAAWTPSRAPLGYRDAEGGIAAALAHPWVLGADRCTAGSVDAVVGALPREPGAPARVHARRLAAWRAGVTWDAAAARRLPVVGSWSRPWPTPHGRGTASTLLVAVSDPAPCEAPTIALTVVSAPDGHGGVTGAVLVRDTADPDDPGDLADAAARAALRACAAARSAPSGRGPCAAPVSRGSGSAARSAPGWAR